MLPLVAPVVLSIVMAIVFHSALALLMGILGPLMVLGGWWHQKKTQWGQFETQNSAHYEALQAYQSALERARGLERANASRAAPSVGQWSKDPLWREPLTPPQVVRIGQGWWVPPKGHELQGTEPLAGIPAAVDVHRGIALVGGSDALDIWRTIVVQWWMASGSEGVEPPIPDSGQPFPTEIRGVSRAVWVSSLADVPRECETLLVASGVPRATIHVPGVAPRVVTCDRITHAEALRALRLRPRVSKDVALTPRDGTARSQLWARLSPEGPDFDLVREGPHTAIWGATGSGKSQTVCSLVLSLAAAYEPQEFVCVVIDFKGGAGLRPLANLPHAIGMVTDLDPLRSRRARSGLEAEMVKRERILAHYGVSDVAELEPSVVCPRLLVVVDEVAWLVTTAPDWADTLVDIAQRGRSLGIHVILSSQRIAGVLPRALMANVSMRICGRVSDDQEVIEWMPDVSPANKNTLRHASPGRVMVAGATSPPAWHDVALVKQWEMKRTQNVSTWRVWAEELPHTFTWEPGAWGWGDYPETQTQEKLTVDPVLDGSVLVVGDSGSGRTSAAWALASLSSLAVAAPPDPAGVWACLSELHGTGTTLVIDNVDQVLHRAGAEGEVFLIDALEGFDGKLVLVTSPRHRQARGLSRLAPQRLVLSLAHSDDHSQWGGPGAAVPGRGLIGGVEVQVANLAPAPSQWTAPSWEPGECDPIVLTETPREWEGHPTRFVGTPEHAMATWQTLGPLVNDGDVVLQGINYRDARLMSAGRIVLPPLCPEHDSVWVWRAGRALLARPAGRERLLP